MKEVSDKSPNNILISKQCILKIASELFSEFGFLGVSMSDIAKRLNVTKSALYYHFRSKKELYLQALEKSFQNLIKTLNRQTSKAGSPDETISRLIRGYLIFGLKEKSLIKSLILKTPDIDSEITNYIVKLRKKINKHFQAFLREIFKMVTSLPLPQKVDLEFITSFLLGTMDRLILEAALFNKKFNIKKKTSQILQIITPILKVAKNY